MYAERPKPALAEHEALTAKTVALNTRLGVVVLMAAALMLAAIYGLMRRELAARQRAERAEAEHRALLERDIESRSRELAQVNEALTESEARLRGIFDWATDAILTVDQVRHRAARERVRDNGSGMDSTASRRHPESFGLLGMQERLRRVGGSLRLHSQRVGGTTVEAHVPMTRKVPA